MAPLLMSQAIQRRPSFWATAAVVPEPMKQSRTRSPGLEDTQDARDQASSGFSVGYRVLTLSLDTANHTECRPTSLCSGDALALVEVPLQVSHIHSSV